MNRRKAARVGKIAIITGLLVVALGLYWAYLLKVPYIATTSQYGLDPTDVSDLYALQARHRADLTLKQDLKSAGLPVAIAGGVLIAVGVGLQRRR